jgi:hypothetical protein
MILQPYDPNTVLDTFDLLRGVLKVCGEADFRRSIRDYDLVIEKAEKWKESQKKEK